MVPEREWTAKRPGCTRHPTFPASITSRHVTNSPKLSGIGNSHFIGLADSIVKNLDRTHTHRVACLSLFHDLWGLSLEDSSGWELETSLPASSLGWNDVNFNSIKDGFWTAETRGLFVQLGLPPNMAATILVGIQPRWPRAASTRVPVNKKQNHLS